MAAADVVIEPINDTVTIDLDGLTIGQGLIDPEITPDHMVTYVTGILAGYKHPFARHHIDSMNGFYNYGLPQIISQVFTIENRIKNPRMATAGAEQKHVEDISYKVIFTGVTLKPPTHHTIKSGSEVAMTPDKARITNATYSATMYVDAEIRVTATYKDGSTETRQAGIQNHRLAAIPCMVRSDYCHTAKCSRETLKKLGEDPTDDGGYFIISGHAWVVDSHENTPNNAFQIHNVSNNYNGEKVRGTFLSKPGDAYENSYQVIFRYMLSGAITIELTTNKFAKLELPFYLLFKALGMTSDRDIVDNIVYGADLDDELVKRLSSLLELAYEVEDSKFAPIRKSNVQTDIVNFIANKTIEGANKAAARRDEDVVKHVNGQILSMLDRYYLPHIGNTPEHRILKLRYTGHLIYKLLCVLIGKIDPTDRDSYNSKRIHPAGHSIGKLFKTTFNLDGIQKARRQLNSELANTPFEKLQLRDILIASLSGTNLENMIVRAIIAGDKVVSIGRHEFTNRISSQPMNLKSKVAAYATKNTISAPNASGSKQNERADEMRRVHATSVGYVDPIQSADTGDKVGLNKQITVTTTITSGSSGFILIEKLTKDPLVIPIDSVEPRDITRLRLAKVFVNGNWIGCCRHGPMLAAEYRKHRRAGLIHHHTSIVCELLVREVYFWTDYGRLVRPLIIVYNNIEEYISRYRAGDRSVVFRQWIRLTKAHLDGFHNGTTTIDSLREQGIVEYIAPDEQATMLVAFDIGHLRESVNDVRRQYTHMDVPQSLFGIITLGAPFANHSFGTRNTYYTNQRKQSAGWYSLAWPFRFDKGVSLQFESERPLVTTIQDKYDLGGQLAIVAIMMYTGRNQEDSVVANRDSARTGLFDVEYMVYEKVLVDPNEIIGAPDIARTLDIKPNVSHENTENGIIREGSIVQKGQVLVSKQMKIPKPVDQYTTVDSSHVYTGDETYRVARVIVSQNEQGTTVNIRMTAYRPIGIGDKVSSRNGNKGIISGMDPRIDMPYTESGLRPDLIVNPHSIPTRMAVAQLLEMIYGIYCAKRGVHVDATIFREHQVRGILGILESEYGVKYNGCERMYSGRTGTSMDTLIFMGPNTYNRLQKYVIDDRYAVAMGAKSKLTGQPLEGKNNGGGLRMGEMEKDTLVGHGTGRAFRNKYCEDSDGTEIYMCQKCGNIAVANEKLGYYSCKTCGDGAIIMRVPSGWAANMFLHEMSAMNIRLHYELEKTSYSTRL